MRNEVNYPTGSRVIVRSNNDEPLMIGTIEKWEEIGGTKVPVIKDEETGKNFFVMGVIRHYHDLLLEALNKLTPYEQWNVLAEFGNKLS
jgi:hypothetical protein